MAIRSILQLGNPRLYEICSPVTASEVSALTSVIQDLHDTLFEFRARTGSGRAIAAPQIGVLKRLVYMDIDQPEVFINPSLDLKSEDMFELWDDCMSFPDLLVRVRRHHTCRITYRDLEWREQTRILEDSLSELLQHECDHLDGILAVARAIDAQSFALRSERKQPS